MTTSWSKSTQILNTATDTQWMHQYSHPRELLQKRQRIRFSPRTTKMKETTSSWTMYRSRSLITKNSWCAKSKCLGGKRTRLACACKARKIWGHRLVCKKRTPVSSSPWWGPHRLSLPLKMRPSLLKNRISRKCSQKETNCSTAWLNRF